MRISSLRIIGGQQKIGSIKSIDSVIIYYICFFCSVHIFLSLFSMAAEYSDEYLFEITYTLPYHTHLASEPIVQIAEAAAKLRALEQSREMLASSLAVKLEVRTREEQLALASAMFPIRIHERTVLDGPQLFVKARCYADSQRTQDEHIRYLLRQPEHLHLRLLAIKKFEEYINEGVELLNQAHSCSSADLRCNQSNSILSRIKTISKRIKALHLFFCELETFTYAWTTPEKTLLTLSEATSLDPDNVLLWLGVGECLVLLHRPYEGIKALQKVTAHNEVPARALYMRGMAHLQMYLPALAIKDISQAVQLEPEHASWWRALGTAKLVAGETITMCEDFYRACAMGDCEGLIEVRERNFCVTPSDRL